MPLGPPGCPRLGISREFGCIGRGTFRNTRVPFQPASFNYEGGSITSHDVGRLKLASLLCLSLRVLVVNAEQAGARNGKNGSPNLGPSPCTLCCQKRIWCPDQGRESVHGDEKENRKSDGEGRNNDPHGLNLLRSSLPNHHNQIGFAVCSGRNGK
ncbi:hypothetical protein D3C85_1428470 [compost metagenome]